MLCESLCSASSPSRAGTWMSLLHCLPSTEPRRTFWSLRLTDEKHEVPQKVSQERGRGCIGKLRCREVGLCSLLLFPVKEASPRAGLPVPREFHSHCDTVPQAGTNLGWSPVCPPDARPIPVDTSTSSSPPPTPSPSPAQLREEGARGFILLAPSPQGHYKLVASLLWRPQP